MNTPTPEEIAACIPAADAVVQKILCYAPDYFKPSKQLQLSWAEHIAAYAPHVPTEDLLAGVTAWYGANFDGSRPTQAAITQAARQLRSERFMAEPVEVQNAYAELRDAGRAHLLYESAGQTRLPPSQITSDSVIASPEFTDCPHCHVKAGMPCRRPDNSNMEGFHQTRLNAASDIAAEKRRALTPPDPRTLFCGECDAHPGDPCTSGGMVMRDVHPERRPA